MDLLSVDYGLAHIGIAVSNGPLARPLPPLRNSPRVLDQIANLVKTHNIQEVVIGSSTGPMEKTIKAFAFNLHKTLKLKVSFQDETLSSKDALKSLYHKSPKNRRLMEHSAAAAIILQNWLDQNLDPSPHP